MKRGIVAGDGFVVRFGDNLVAAHHHRTNRNLVFGCCEPCLLQRSLHPAFTTHDAPRTTHGRYARTGSRSFSKLSELPSFARSTLIRSPSANVPSRTDTASGFCNNRWIARFKGRAPYTGS